MIIDISFLSGSIPPPGVKGYALPSCPPPTEPPCQQTEASIGYPRPQRTTPAASKGYPQPQQTTPAASKGYPQPQRTTPAATKGYPHGVRGQSSSVEAGSMRLYQGLQSRHGDTARTRYTLQRTFESSYSAPSRLTWTMIVEWSSAS